MKKLMSFKDFQTQKIEANMCRLVYGGKTAVSTKSTPATGTGATDSNGQGSDETWTTYTKWDDGCGTREVFTSECPVT